MTQLLTAVQCGRPVIREHSELIESGRLSSNEDSFAIWLMRLQGLGADGISGSAAEAALSNITIYLCLLETKETKAM